jgi:hypothetical protein
MMRERYLHLPPENEFGWIAATVLVLRQSPQSMKTAGTRRR